MKQNIKPNKPNTKHSKLIISILIGFIIVFSFVAGASLMCSHSGGVIERGSYACKQLKIIGLCELDDSVYAADPIKIQEYLNKIAEGNK